MVVVEGGVIFVQRFDVLAVARAYLANRRHPHGHQIMVGMGGVALEITLQPPLFQRNRQIIGGQGKVIHTNKHIAFSG